MKLHLLAVALATLQSALAHTLFTTLFVEDVNQGDGTCIRMSMPTDRATDPVDDLSSDDMACGKPSPLWTLLRKNQNSY